MRLKPVPKPAASRELRLRLEADTVAELEAYAELYEAEYRERIEVAKLAAEIVRQFLEGDRAFRAWKKERGRGGRRSARSGSLEAAATAAETLA